VLEPGSRFAAYEVLDRLAVGGMGEVYRARHRLLDRIDALKVLRPHLSSDEAFRRRFLREALSAARLRHPHIVTVYTADEVDDQLYLAMEYIDGADLSSVLHTDGPLNADRVIRLLAETAEALDSAHSLGMAHRDVKPGNILIADPGSKTEKAYLVDFGLTKAHSVEDQQITATGQVLGSLAYIAPEQIDGVDKGGSVDQYALACVAFEVLTGRIPFVRDNPVASISAHLSAPPPEVTELRPDLPKAMDAVIVRGMAKKIEDRYPNCADFVQALSEALHPTSQPTSPPAAAPFSAPPAPFSAPPAGPVQQRSGPPSAPPAAPPTGPVHTPANRPPSGPPAPVSGPAGLPYQQPGPGVPNRPPQPTPYPNQQGTPPPGYPPAAPQTPGPAYPGQRPPPAQSGGIPSRTPVPQGYLPPAGYQQSAPIQQPPPLAPQGRQQAPNRPPQTGPAGRAGGFSGPPSGGQNYGGQGFAASQPPAAGALSVVVVGGPSAGQVLPLPLGEAVLGSTGPLTVDDSALDAQHVRFRVNGWVVTAEPVGSASVRLDGVQLTGPRQVQPTQIIDAGSSLLEVRPSDRLSRASADLALPDPVSIMAAIAREGSPLRRGPQHPLTLLTRVGWRHERPPRVMAMPLGESTGAAVRGKPDEAAALVRWMIGQAAALHDPRDLCLATALVPVGPERWSWVRALPHARPGRGPLQGPHVTSDSEGAADLVNRLLMVIERRRVVAAGGPQNQNIARHPRVLAILDDSADSPKADELTATGPPLGIHVLRVLGPHRRVPRTCGYCIDIQGPGPAAVVVHAGTPSASLGGIADGVDATWSKRLADILEQQD
jgi:serine/threonine protein kinase